MRAAFIVATALVATLSSQSTASAEAEPLVEEPEEPGSSLSLSLFGGGAFPLGDFADRRKLGLAARASFAWTMRNGIGAAVSGGYSPLPANPSAAESRREHNVAHAALAPRFTLGRNTFRLFVGGGGGVVYERTKRTTIEGEAVTSATTEAAAVAEAGLELHFADAGGFTIAGVYTLGVGKTKTELASAQAGFVLSF